MGQAASGSNHRIWQALVVAATLAIPPTLLAVESAHAALSSRTLTPAGDLVLVADGAATSVGVGYWDDVVRVAVSGGAITEYPVGQVRRVIFQGGSGDDNFNAAGMLVPVIASGSGGNDTLLSGSASDVLNGGPGADTVRGNDGDDTLVLVDNGVSDTAIGGTGRDAIWTDVTGGQRDTVQDLTGEDMNNAIARFANRGADRTLNGDSVPDPTTTGGRNYASFAGNPLFPATGPSGRDPRQGSLSDCKTISALSAVPHNTPSGNAWPIRSRMADFGDGTFGIRLDTDFYRLDADLPVASNGRPAYAKLAADDSLWVALAEKAMAYKMAPAGAPAYSVLNSSGSHRVFAAYGSGATGTPLIKNFASSARQLGSKLFTKWNTFENVTITLSGGHTTRLVDRHAYTVWQVNRNGAGRVTTLVLRNPWGTDTGNRNPGYVDANPSDGIVTVTPAQVYAGKAGGRVNWGTRIA